MPASPQARFLPGGDTALVVEFGDRVDQRLSGLVLALAHRLEDAAIPGVVEVVPTFRSLMVHYDPLRLPQAELKRRLAPLLGWPGGRRERRPPLAHSRLLRRRAWASIWPMSRGARGSAQPRSSSATAPRPIHVYMMGFLPGLPYLGGLPPEFELPRRENPRIKVPRGSIAVAMAMTVVYPLESPGGWHILARTPGAPVGHARAIRPRCSPPATRWCSSPMSLGEYEALLAQAAAGDLRLVPEQPAREPRA